MTENDAAIQAIEQRLKRVDDSLAKQLQTSMSFNARMVTRLKTLQNAGNVSDAYHCAAFFEAIDCILKDKDPTREK